MSNMSYCLFQNTVPDLRDCVEAMNETQDDSVLPPEELRARLALIKLCVEVADNYGEELT
jgi:hypothetical protein